MRHTTRRSAGGIITAAGLVLAAFPLLASGESTSGELEIEAGLNEVMSVVCDQPLKFGVTSIRSGDRGGHTTVALDRSNNDTNLGGNSENIGAELNSEGEATFKVTGTLTIPKNAPADPGGYATTITVEVNDSP